MSEDMIVISQNVPPAIMTVGPTSNPSGNSFKNLFPALLQCFAIIFAGYFAGRINLISQKQGKGIAIFVSKFAMPALLFKSMCELPFGVVNWWFLASICIGKVIVFTVVVIFTLLLVRPTHLGKIGIYGIFATQSHDFALGIPIVQALYSHTHPDYERYLYLIAPISVAFLNPVGFLMMEIHKWRTSDSQIQRSRCRAITMVMLGVITNPIVFMTILGIGGNFVFHQKVPSYLDNILIVLKQSFSATALFCLGHNNVGRMNKNTKKGYFTPALLIAAKMLLTPFLIRELVTSLLQGSDAKESVDMSTYGFLYGMFPTAPTVFIYASLYNMQAEMIAMTMVVCTFLAAPLMFISGKMMTLPIDSEADYAPLIRDASLDVSIVSLCCTIWVLVVFLFHRRFRNIPHQFTSCLVLSQILVAVGVILHHSLDTVLGWKHYVTFIPYYVGILSARCWMPMLAVSLCLLKTRSLCFLLRVRHWIILYGFGLPVFLCGMLLMTTHRNISSKDSTADYGKTQRVIALVVLTVNSMVTVVMLVVGHRYELLRQLRRKQLSTPTEPPTPTTPTPMFLANGGSSSVSTGCSRGRNPEDCLISQSAPATATLIVPTSTTQVNAPLVVHAGTRQVKRKGRRKENTRADAGDICENCQDCGATVTNIEDIVPDPIRRYRDVEDEEHGLTESSASDALLLSDEEETLSEKTCFIKGSNCTPTDRRECASLLRQYEISTLPPIEEDEERLLLQDQDTFQHVRHVVLILLLLVSAFVGVCLVMWQLFKEQTTGVYVEIQFLDCILNYGQGIFTFVTFGLDSKMVLEPLTRRMRKYMSGRYPFNRPSWQRFWYGAEHVKVPAWHDLDTSSQLTCEQFLRYHRAPCETAIVSEKRINFRTYRDVFLGTEFVDWLIEIGLANERSEAVEYGHRLLNGRVIEHVHNEHHFYDLPYFYIFVKPGTHDSACSLDGNISE